MRIAYCRVSTASQNLQRQEEALEQYGIDKWFKEKVSAKDTNRPKLQEMLDFVREGDTICYGDMNDKCILILEIMSYKKTPEGDVPEKILIQVVDPKNQANIMRQGSKDGLYEAFTYGMFWYEKILTEN